MLAVLTDSPESLPVEALVTTYLNASECSINSLKAKSIDLREFLAFLKNKLGRELIGGDLTFQHADEFLKFCETKKLAHTTIRRRFMTIRNFSKFLFERYRIYDFALKLRFRGLIIVKYKGLSKVEREMLIASLNSLSDRDAFVVRLLLYTGIRCAEARNLRLKDIQEKRIVIREGKGGKTDTVPIFESLKAPLADYLKLRNFNYPKYDDAPLIYSDKSKGTNLVNVRTISRVVESAMKAVGIKEGLCGPHTLRHSFARHSYTTLSVHYKPGEALALVSKYLRHSGLQVTNIYLQNHEEEEEEAAKYL